MKTNQKSSIKNHQWIKTGIFAAIFTLLTISIHAQTLPSTPNPITGTDPHWTEFTTAGTVESIDSVTIGSRMPYRVAPLTGVPADLSVQYKWLFSPALIVKSLDGVTTLNSSTSDDFYAANEISVVMPSSEGDITIKTNVRYMMGDNPLCAGADDDTYTIRVLDRPTISWTDNNTKTYGCKGSDITISNVGVTGYRQFEIQYAISRWDEISETPAGTADETNSNQWMVLGGTSGKELTFPGGMFAKAGTYKITITNITDRISRKSLDMSLVAATTADLPSEAYTVMILEAPTTNTLQHIRNVAQ